jgi:pimeloyl-ACP methyl ester carboxylesterase
MVSAWRETMAFDSRSRLAEIGCPSLVAASNSSQLVIIDGADHALIWTHTDELVRVTDEFLGA